MTKDTKIQYGIAAETWEVGGDLLEDGLIDGPTITEDRGDRDQWQKRLEVSIDYARKRPTYRMGNGEWAGKTLRQTNFRLVQREVTIEATDWMRTD